MEEEKMLVPSGLKTVDGKDIMCYTVAFYLKNKEKIDKMLKKCEEILREEEQKSKEFKGKNENIIREETEKYYINQKHDKMFKEMLSDKKSTVDFINSFLHLNLVEDDIEKYEKEFRTSEFSNVEADVVYKIKNKNVFILIEHQSSVDYKMSYRIMRYKYAIIESAIDNAKRNAAANNVTNAEFICGDAGKIAEILYSRGERPDVIIADPARKGCTRDALEYMAKMSPDRIVMISCNHATAARDCAVLEDLGYKTVKVKGVDLFGRTGHVETVCLLSRK